MAARIHRARWGLASLAQKPPPGIPLELDPHSPFYGDVIMVVPFTEGTGVPRTLYGPRAAFTDQLVASNGVPDYVAGFGGLQMGYNGSNQAHSYVTGRSPLSGVNALTVLSRAHLSSFRSTFNSFLKADVSIIMGTDNAASNHWRVILWNSASAGVSVTGTTVITTNVATDLVLTWAAGDFPRMYQRIVGNPMALEATGGSTISGVMGNGGTKALSFGADASGSKEWWPGNVYHTIALARQLDIDGLRELADNPYGLVRPAIRRRLYVDQAAGSTVFFTGLSRIMTVGKLAPQPLVAPLSGIAASVATAKSSPAATTAVAGKSNAGTNAKATASPTSAVSAKTQVASTARATASPTLPLAGKASGTNKGRAAPAASTSLAGKTTMQAQGRAQGGGQSILSALGRATAIVTGRAQSGLAISLGGKAMSISAASALASKVVTAAGKATAQMHGLAQSGGQSILSAFARATTATTGRAAGSVVSPLAGKATTESSARAAGSGTTALAAKATTQTKGAAQSGGQSILAAAARATTATTGRALAGLSTQLGGRAKGQSAGSASGAGRTSLAGRTTAQASARAQGTTASILQAVGRALSKATGRAQASLSSPVAGVSQTSSSGRLTAPAALISLLGRAASIFTGRAGKQALVVPAFQVAPDQIPASRTSKVKLMRLQASVPLLKTVAKVTVMRRVSAVKKGDL